MASVVSRRHSILGIIVRRVHFAEPAPIGLRGVKVNSVAPGFTMSERIEAQRDKLQFNVDMSLKGRAIKRDELPEDIVGAMVFLASADSDFITGQTIVIDGGLVMH